MKRYIGFLSAAAVILFATVIIVVNKPVIKVLSSGLSGKSSQDYSENNKNAETGILKNMGVKFHNNIKRDSNDLEENPVAGEDNKEEKDNVNKSKYKHAEGILLVNKKNILDGSFIPKDLVTPKVSFKESADPIVRVMDREAAEALERMFNAANKDGITLMGVSGYRSYKIQVSVYNSKVKKSGKSYADKYIAQPGTSEHQTGLAMDMLSSDYSVLNAGFENTSAFKWLDSNAHKYGFILRYPKGKENITGYNYEPWHYRYVGIDASEEIKSHGITLEEYLEN